VIKIVTDSTSYLPKNLRATYDVRVVPLSLLLGRTAYREGVDLDGEAFFRLLSEDQTLFPTTSQPAPEDFLAVWRPLIEAGHKVVSILISSRLSGTVEAARAAARLVTDAPVTVVDSLSTAMGLGMQVLRAAELAQQGMSREEIVAAVERMRDKVQIILVPDTLEYLHRGGRINTARALLGTLLRVKPLLILRQGAIEPLEQVRTARRAHARLIELCTAHLDGDREPWISVMHSRAPDVAQGLLREMRDRFPGARFFMSEIGPVVGAHLGPGAVGLLSIPSTVL